MANRTPRGIPWWFFALFIGVGAIMLIAGGLWTAKVRDFLATAVEAEGVIVDYAVQRSDDGQTMYAAIIEFTAADGEPYQFTAGTSSSWKPRPGKPVTVLYDPLHPHDAQRQGFWSQWLGPVIFIGLGLIFLTLGLLLWYFLHWKPGKARRTTAT